MSFRSLKADIVDRNILSTDYFAEEVKFTPEVGSERTITVKISAVQTSVVDDYGNEEERERIRVKVRRNATSGIALPRMGDRLLRSEQYDPEQRQYAFTGEKPEVSSTHWVLIYSRLMVSGRSPTR